MDSPDGLTSLDRRTEKITGPYVSMRWLLVNRPLCSIPAVSPHSPAEDSGDEKHIPQSRRRKSGKGLLFQNPLRKVYLTGYRSIYLAGTFLEASGVDD
ncbi:hypothetical protein DTO027B5_4506 [Paecilomyces variotii]|nr:hypothetical protein DTO027B3_5437 [Paecilomyces variotii]KAJ9333726.1 hypothetical protein DTO027B5_4506 [Paecilomyces variotii]